MPHKIIDGGRVLNMIPSQGGEERTKMCISDLKFHIFSVSDESVI